MAHWYVLFYYNKRKNGGDYEENGKRIIVFFKSCVRTFIAVLVLFNYIIFLIFMPLKGILDGKEIIAPLLSDSEWNDLRDWIEKNDQDIIIAQTGKKGYLRTSSRNLKHFVHKKGESPDNWKPESWQHLKAKEIVLKACIEAGWHASPEYNNENWIADVLAYQGKKRIAFEIQWSKQTLQDTLERQERYKIDNVRGCWFFNKLPIAPNRYDFKETNELPAFQIEFDNEENILVTFRNEKIPLGEFVKMLLTKKIGFFENVFIKKNIELEVDFYFYKRPCYNCNQWHYRYWINRNNMVATSNCKDEIYFSEHPWEEKRLRFEEDIIKEALSICKQYNYKLAEISKRFSKTVDKKYFAFSCPNCQAIIGDFFLEEDEDKARKFEHYSRIIITDSLSKRPSPNGHWCYSCHHEQDPK